MLSADRGARWRARPAGEAPARLGAWAAVMTVAVALLVLDAAGAWSGLELPDWVGALAPGAALVVTTGYALALAVRTGGRPLVAGAVALVLTLAAVLSAAPVLLAGAAVSAAALGAVLGVLLTVPAARFGGVVRECGIAVLVALVAGLAARGFHAELSLERAGYLVLALGLGGSLVVVYRLGAGLHGLGRRGTLVVVAGLLLLAGALAYTEALARWGSPGLVETSGSVVTTLRDTLGAVPRPIEVLLGYPALAWGISTRARRRQGWWGCAFGAAGLAQVAAALLVPDLDPVAAALTLGYGAVLGLALGYLVIRADALLAGHRDPEGRRAELAATQRPEPGRLAPLL